MSVRIARTLDSLRTAMRSVQDIILPPVCLACNCEDISADGLCDQCNLDLLQLVAGSYCLRCGSSIGPNIPIREDGCYGCPTPMPRFSRVFRIGPYSPPLKTVVRNIKFRQQDGLSARLVEMLAQAIRAEARVDEYDIVMPVAMHWRRRLWRRYDHSLLLAGGLAKRLGLALGNELYRKRNTPQQAHLSRTQRLVNVRGAFGVRNPKRIVGAHVLLVDDITTTGATANEAARALLAAGVARVSLAVICKTEKPVAYGEATKIAAGSNA